MQAIRNLSLALTVLFVAGCSSFTRQSCSSSTASTRPKLLRQTSIT